MKKVVLFLLTTLLFCSLFADDEAFSLYFKKDYQAAYNAFYSRFIESDGDPLCSYNLGVAAEALDKKGEALYFYLQALQKAPDFPEAKNNLSIVAKDLAVTVPQSLLEPLYAVDFSLVLFFISLYAFVILLSVLCFFNDWRIKTALLPLFLIMAVSASFYYIKYNECSKDKWAVIVQNGVLKSGPDLSLSEIGKVKEGEIINIMTSSGSWYKVKSFQDNVEGWIELGAIRALMRGRL